MKILDVSSIQDIPGYVEILKFVLKSQIQNLVEQLQDHAGEETLVLSANLTAGTLSHLESERGQGFLDMREDIKSQFLTHCLQGKQKYHTAEPPGQRTVGQKSVMPPRINLSGNRATDEQLSTSITPNSSKGELASTAVSQDASNILSQTDKFEMMHSGTSQLTEIEDGRIVSSRSAHSENSRLLEAGAFRLPESSSVIIPQMNSSTFTQSGSPLYSKKLDVNDVTAESTSETQKLFSGSHDDTHNLLLLGNQAETHKFLLPSNHELPQQPTISNSVTMQTLDKVKDPLLLTNTHQSNKHDCIPQQNQNKLFPINTLLSGSVTNLPFVAQSVSGQFTNLSTINHTAVKDIMNFPLHTPVVPQFTPSLLSNMTPVKVPDKNQNITSQVKSTLASSLLCADTIYNMSAYNKSSPNKIVPVSNTPNLENFMALKANADLSLVHENTLMTPNSPLSPFLKQDNRPTNNEGVSKTTKRKQKRSTGPKTQSENVLLPDSPVKKLRVLTSEFSANQNLVTMQPLTTCCQNKDQSNTLSATSLITNFPTHNATNTTGFSLLKMQPVVLIDDPTNQGKRKIFIESSAINTVDSGSKTLENSKSLLDESSGHFVSTVSSVTKHVVDGKEKDKTKKTLSSKIDEITQRITKDDTIKQHTVQTSDCDQDIASCSNSSRITSAGCHSNCDSSNNDSPSVSTPPSVEHVHDGDPSKLKDGSRASHRKPKLPRYNIGVASDDEDNADVVNPADVTSPGTPNKSNISQFPISPSAVNIGHDEAQDIISIQVGGDDSETSFPHINLEELADGLLLTDLPIVSYYNNVEDSSSKSLIESVFNLKPGRDPSTKKPLNSQSVIVSGSKLEKDWVKCPLCPDKFLTVEALQYHIKNVNHVAKKYECDLCKRKFSQLRDMERHRRIHTGERPFTCDVCNKSFSRKDNLKSHARKHTMK